MFGKIFDFSNLRGDIFGGITAGIIALPLALAFGTASGAGPIAGLYGAIIVGFLASLFGGTGSQISGPTGPMVVVFAGVYETMNGNAELVFAAVVLAGLMQILFGVLKFGQYIKLVPYPVISGFMSGIGVIIIALQIPRLFGYEPESSGVLGALATLPHVVSTPNFSALFLSGLTLLAVFFWPHSIRKYCPPPLAVLILGTLVATALPNIPVLGEIPTGLPEFVVPGFSQDTLLVALQAAFVLALLGTIDSLLTSLVADNMTHTRHNSNRELIGQGVGNTIAGFFGGIPGAGATMRTVVNVRSGGRTKISGMIHGTVLLSFVLVLGPFASQIPHAVLAGILVKVGYDIIDFTYLKRAHKGPRWDLVLMVIVLGLTVFVNLITAVIVGVFLGAVAFVKQIADEQMAQLETMQMKNMTKEEKDLLEKAEGHVVVYDFSGPLSFGAVADLGHHAREKFKEQTEAIILNFEHVPFLDVSAAQAIEAIVCYNQKAGKAVFVSGASADVEKTLKTFSDQFTLPEEAYKPKRLDAIKAAVKILEQ